MPILKSLKGKVAGAALPLQQRRLHPETERAISPLVFVLIERIELSHSRGNQALESPVPD
jgi:hypothetical protein